MTSCRFPKNSYPFSTTWCARTTRSKVELGEEIRDDVRAVRVGDAAVVFAPSLQVGVGVGPQEVAQHAHVWNIRGALDLYDLLQVLQLRGRPAVDAEDLLVHNRRERQAVEDVAKHAPQFDVVPPLALVVEPVDARDGVALVVPAQQEEVLGVLHLVRQQKANHLQALLSAVHVVAQKQVFASGGNPPYSNRRSRSEYWPCTSPQIFSGASSSKRHGCDRKISLCFVRSRSIRRNTDGRSAAASSRRRGAKNETRRAVRTTR